MTTKTDILIIGGGIIGACTALFLTRAGKQVTVIERGDICAGASHGNACWIAAGYAIPTAAPGVIKQGLRWMFDASSPFSIKPRLNLDLLKWLWTFRGACNEEQMLAGAEVIDNLIFATGHGMLGITHGPITAKLVTEILTEQEPSIDLTSMKPERY